jgi:hypothetical protein
MDIAVAVDRPPIEEASAARRRIADRVFWGSFFFHAALTVYWVVLYLTGWTSPFFREHSISLASLGRIAAAVGLFYIVWGFIWWGVKTALLKYMVGFTKEERRRAFSSRMDAAGYNVADLVARYSERRIRIADMIGRRGRFMVMMLPGLFFLYLQVRNTPTANFATIFLQENLFEALATNWIFLGFYYANGILAASFYGAQSRVMDGVLARANCLLITTLWTAFKFVMLPIGAALATMFPPNRFAVLFVLIWCSYAAADAFSEIGGSLFGKQKLKVWGLGDVNRKSVGGTVSGFVASLAVCLLVVLSAGLPAPWIVLAVVIACSNSLLELYSPRGTDDFVMATTNALICLAFGALIT